MSVEGDEDTELRDLVAATLQASGVLGKLKVRNLNLKKREINFSFGANFGESGSRLEDCSRWDYQSSDI